jgi:mRNA interferase RelE/StbE
MTYKIIFSTAASRSLIKLTANLRNRIKEKLEALAGNPFAPNNNLKKLKGEPGYRLRVGDWRVIYELDNGRLIVFVVKIGPRGDIYD